ncbi:hypothetical protein CR513_42662, partial [Mucuna pruriens]
MGLECRPRSCGATTIELNGLPFESIWQDTRIGLAFEISNPLIMKELKETLKMWKLSGKC